MGAGWINTLKMKRDLKRMTLYLIRRKHAKGEARISLYIVCLSSYAGFTPVNCQLP